VGQSNNEPKAKFLHELVGNALLQRIGLPAQFLPMFATHIMDMSVAKSDLRHHALFSFIGPALKLLLPPQSSCSQHHSFIGLEPRRSSLPTFHYAATQGPM